MDYIGIAIFIFVSLTWTALSFAVYKRKQRNGYLAAFFLNFFLLYIIFCSYNNRMYLPVPGASTLDDYLHDKKKECVITIVTKQSEIFFELKPVMKSGELFFSLLLLKSGPPSLFLIQTAVWLTGQRTAMMIYDMLKNGLYLRTGKNLLLMKF
ncbi:MAG: hypothetical protein GY795_33565 [Desulfobacterales bacterium]|nr:hypothetical protein [Desulfobacterales bacterium]